MVRHILGATILDTALPHRLRNYNLMNHHLQIPLILLPPRSWQYLRRQALYQRHLY